MCTLSTVNADNSCCIRAIFVPRRRLLFTTVDKARVFSYAPNTYSIRPRPSPAVVTPLFAKAVEQARAELAAKPAAKPFSNPQQVRDPEQLTTGFHLRALGSYAR